MKIIPRPYQWECAKACCKDMKMTGKALMVIATGLGKTITTALTLKLFGKLPALFLVHNNGILEQSISEFRKVFGDSVRLGLYNSHADETEGADIVFASFQKMNLNRHCFDRERFKVIAVDEGHHASAETFSDVINHFPCPRVGATATPDRMDMKDIREIFGNESYNLPLEEAIARGQLPKIEYHVVTDEGLDEKKLAQIAHEVIDEGERLSIKEVNRRIFIRARDRQVANVIHKYGKKVIVFCQSIRHAEHMRKSLRKARTYHSGKPWKINRRTLREFKEGHIQNVLAVNSFNEGINVPDTDVVVFNRSTESETIFRQQLGRGLRPGKDKLIVLDFVGNIERIQMVRDLTEKVGRLHSSFTSTEEKKREGYVHDQFQLSGAGFKFTFADQVVRLTQIVDRLNVDFYPTWQEAGKAAIALGIGTERNYIDSFHLDNKLPSQPTNVYADFPGWGIFLGTGRTYRQVERMYPSWQLASKAAIKLGIRIRREYSKKYKGDPLLPSDPWHVYKDFPGTQEFLGIRNNRAAKFYLTCQEASQAACELKIKSRTDYRIRYKSDPRLPCQPENIYADFPGWERFLKKREVMTGLLYKTCTEASLVAHKYHFTGERDYKARYKIDTRLPSTPEKKYLDFPGWHKFLGIK